MKHIYFLLLFTLITAQAFAQKDFRPGYIVQNGDTLQGLVDYRGSTRSAKSAAFKSTPEASEQEFSPADISGYGFPNDARIFESKSVPATETEPAQELFLNVLIKGKASIYTYRDSFHRDHFYLSKDDGELIELVQKEYNRLDLTTNKNLKVIERTYQSTLAAAFYDCNEPGQARIKGVKLAALSLVAITNRYNQCAAPERTVFNQYKGKASVTIYPLIAYTHSNLKFSGSTYLSEIAFTNELPLSAGVAFNIAVPNFSEKLTIQIDALAVAAKFKGSGKEGPTMGRSNSYQTKFDMLYLKLPLQLRYTYPQGLLRPFVNGGLMMGYAVIDKNETYKESTMGSTSYTETTPAVPSFRPLMQGLTGGAGLHYPMQGKNLTLEARYELNTGLSWSEDIISSLNAFYLLLGYSF